MKHTSSTRTERVLNRLIIIIGILCAGAWAWYFTRPVPEPINPADEIYSAGETLPPIPSFSTADHPRSLVMFLSSRCQVCTDGMTFYRTLATTKVERGSTIPIVALSFDSQPDFDRYLQEHRFGPDVAASVLPSAFKNRRTPVLLLVDRQGKVVQVWRGRLTEPRQAEILSLFMESSSN